MEFDRKKIPSYLMILTIVAVAVFFNVLFFNTHISANDENIVDYDLSDEDINPVRESAVAGLFYPADVYQLDKDLDGYLEHVPSEMNSRPNMIIVPHAGYRYSAQVAAVAIVLIIASVLTDKKYRVGWRYYVFILLAVRLLIPVRLTLPFSVVDLPAPPEMPPVMEYIEQVPETGNVYEEFEVSQNSEPVQTVKKRVITPTGVLYIIWLGGAAGIIIWNMIIH